MKQNIDELKRSVVDIGKQMVAKEFSAPTDGNVSFRTKDRVFITVSAKSKAELTVNDMIEVDLDGNVIGEGKPSTELALHLLVYRERPDIQAVVHAHPPFATAFAVANLPLEKNSMSEIVSTLGVVPLAAYGTPSTEELPNSLLPYVKQCNAMLLANHGAITYGHSLQDAWYGMERLEHYARISYYARQLGGEKEIPQHEVDKLLNIRKDVYKITSPQMIHETQDDSMDDLFSLAEQLTQKLKRLKG